MSTFIKGLNQQKKESIARQTRRSAKWFQNKIKNFAKDSRKQIASRPTIGKLYTYVYDPKLKEKLPHYDIFPMTMPFSIHSDGWTGINFHYLHPQMRAMVMGRLIKINGNKQLNDRTKLKLNWGVVQGIASSGLINSSIHRYLTSHVKSKIIVIPADEWKLAVSLPTAKFVGKSKQEIYKLSK